MNALFVGLLIFQLIISIDYIFPNVINNIIDWHKELFEPMEK